MFLGRLVRGGEIVIFGGAIGMRHVDGRDEATGEDRKIHDGKEEWPVYVRVHHAEFVAGTLSNGISLSRLMTELGADSFASTQRNRDRRAGENTDPRKAYLQQAAVELTGRGARWLNERLQQSFERYGVDPAAELDGLYVPELAHELWQAAR